MPKEDERRKELTQKEIEAEKFRTFFSTSVAQVPEAMSRREEEETPPKRGLFGGLFRREKPESETRNRRSAGWSCRPRRKLFWVMTPRSLRPIWNWCWNRKRLLRNSRSCRSQKGRRYLPRRKRHRRSLQNRKRTGARETGRSGKACGSGKARGAGEERKTGEQGNRSGTQ